MKAMTAGSAGYHNINDSSDVAMQLSSDSYMAAVQASRAKRSDCLIFSDYIFSSHLSRIGLISRYLEHIVRIDHPILATLRMSESIRAQSDYL
jgi:hypothetical protein